MFQIEQVSYMKSEALKGVKSSNTMRTTYNELSCLELIVHIGLLFNDAFLSNRKNQWQEK